MPDRSPVKTRRIIKPRVKPGQPLNFATELAAANIFPPTLGKNAPGPGPTATPFLVVPAFDGDSGTRPIPTEQAFESRGIQVIDENEDVVDYPLVGRSYTLTCTVENLGLAGAYAGFAEFYLATPGSFDNLSGSLRPRPAGKGYNGFSTLPGAASTIRCPNQFTPASDEEAASSVLVQVYDFVLDRLVSPFDAVQDRHVGRRDTRVDFSGTWVGAEFGPFPPPGEIGDVIAVPIRMIVTQSGIDVQVTIQQTPGIPGLTTLAGRVIAGRVVLNFPPNGDQWILTLPDLETLSFQHTTPIPGSTTPALRSGNLSREVPDFTGTWDGTVAPVDQGPIAIFSAVRFVIVQTGLDAQVTIFQSDFGFPVPATPFKVTQARVTQTSFQMQFTAVGSDGVVGSNSWQIVLVGPSTINAFHTVVRSDGTVRSSGQLNRSSGP